MTKEIIINASMGETRIAILEEKRLVELFVEKPDRERMVGDIYLGKVVNVVKGMRAAFVNIGHKQDAFLHFSDIGETFSTVSSMVDRDEDNNHVEQSFRPDQIKVGQEILVQIIKEPISTKGSRLTTEISIPGRFTVLVPNSTIVGVSKKIDSIKERRRLRKLAKSVQPDGFGVIVRTVAEGRDDDVLKSDIYSLLKVWNKLEKKLKSSKPPMLIYKDMGMLSSVIRDLFTSDVERLVVDSSKLYREIVSYLKEVGYSLIKSVENYNKRTPIFDFYGIESEIEASLARKVLMKSGGSIVFDQTEALVAIDVNSGKFIGHKDHEQNSLRINLEAATEIARQLRLRDLGGIIVIDFIDMRDEKNKRRLHEEFKKELRKDRAQANITPISEFGLIEMTRERIRPSLLFTFSETCSTCKGLGRITAKGTVLTKIERWVKRFKATSRDRRIKLTTHPEIKKFLTDGIRNPIRRIMWNQRILIDLQEDVNLESDEFHFYSHKNNVDITEKFNS
ncbi:Rne/Rng family ribonuclease [candidate division KSB1 bacterium]|nr:Rne/Rng family ribonuclease [candidate division KSB1 bacterium]